MNEKGINIVKAMEIFFAVADSGSMTVAARNLRITQSAVSQYIKQLESELELKLLDRRVRPIRLTAAGSVLRSQGVKLLLDVGEIRSTMRRIGGDELNELRIGVIGSFLGTLMPDLVTAITDQIHIKRIVVLRGFATARDDLLKKREVDMLITSDPLLEMGGLERFDLFTEPFVLLLPADLNFPLPVGTAPHPGSLAGLAERLPLIRYTKRSRTGWAVETHLRRLRLDVPVTYEFDSNEDIVAMVSAGRGWSITTPSQILQGMRSTTALQLVPFPKPGFSRTTTLVMRSGEMEPLSQKIAGLSCEVIRTKYLPRLQGLAPWLRETLHVGE